MIAPVNGGRMGGLGDGWKIELRIVDGLYNACHIVTGKQDAAAGAFDEVRGDGIGWHYCWNAASERIP